MEKGSIKLVKYKIGYQKLAQKISELRQRGEEPPFEIIMQAYQVGRIAHIPENTLDKLLRG